MKSFKIKLYNDLGNLVLDQNVRSNGKEEAIDHVMQELFKKHFYVYMTIEKAAAKEICGS